MGKELNPECLRHCGMLDGVMKELDYTPITDHPAVIAAAIGTCMRYDRTMRRAEGCPGPTVLDHKKLAPGALAVRRCPIDGQTYAETADGYQVLKRK